MLDDLQAWLAIARAPGLHAGLIAGGPAAAPLPQALLDGSALEPQARELPTAGRAALRSPDLGLLESDVRWLSAPGHRLVTWGSQAYPARLATIADAPLVLFCAGDTALLERPQLAMVGARNPTTVGRETATRFAEHFSRHGLTVTSGLALGIDAASHRGALRAPGSTIAVLGNGPDQIYPAEHAALARELAEAGLLVSEFPPGTPPRPQHFPRRNRIISGLSLGTLVVEAALHSGSLITARLAAEQGREVFAIPGSIHSALSKGCHRLIREGAKLVETADDVMSELDIPAAPPPAAAPETEAADAQRDFSPMLDKDYEILLDALGFEPASVDTLVARTGLKADVVASMLLILELEGRIEQQPGGIFCRRLAGK
jgi:DNA processing protein